MAQFILISICFLLGTLILHHFSVLPPNGVLYFYPLTIVALLLSKQRVFVGLCFIALGFGWAHLQAFLLLQQQIPEQHIAKDIVVEGYIASLPKRDAHKTQFEFEIKQFKQPEIKTTPGKVLLSWYRKEDLNLHVGDKWQFTVRLKPPRNFSNPAGFDYSGWLLQKRILHTGYIRDKQPMTLLQSNAMDYPVDRVRQSIRQKMSALPIQEHAAPFLNALLIGDRVGLQVDDWSVLQKTGTSHLMAISGLHIGLIAGFAFLIGRFVWGLSSYLSLRFAAQRAAAIFAWLNAVVYAALAGFTIPTQRALIMLSILLLVVILQKRIRPPVALSVTLLIVLIFDSFAVLSASFWLSFFAVALIYFFIAVRNRDHSQNRIKLRQWLSLQFMISLGLLPLTILFFQQAPFISPVANLLAVPIVGFVIVPLCFVGGVLLVVNTEIAGVILKFTASIFELLWQFLSWISELSISSINFSAPSVLTLCLAITGFIVMLLPSRFYLRLAGMVCILPLFFPHHPRPAQGEINFSVLDVGQGLSTVVETTNHVLVFDAGPRFSDRFDAGQAVIVPYLRDRGISTIDRLVVSHGDNDHIGGVESVLQNLKVSSIISSVPAHIPNYESAKCYLGQTWQWDGVEFTVLHPDKSDYETGLGENDLSCVLQVTTNRQRILLTGDIEQTAEALLQQRHQNLQSDVLVVPHHGSKTSSTAAFIKQVAPSVAIIPVGWRNRYRFPHASVLQTYSEQGSQIITTAQSGAVMLDSETNQITHFRPEHLRYWERH